MVELGIEGLGESRQRVVAFLEQWHYSCSVSLLHMNMRIDAHQHFWRYNPAEYDWIDESMQSLRRDFLPQDLKRELD